MIVADVGFVGAICIIAFIIWVFKASNRYADNLEKGMSEDEAFYDAI